MQAPRPESELPVGRAAFFPAETADGKKRLRYPIRVHAPKTGKPDHVGFVGEDVDDLPGPIELKPLPVRVPDDTIRCDRDGEGNTLQVQNELRGIRHVGTAGV